MGGSISISMRNKQGKVRTVETWTNAISNMLIRPASYEGNQTWWDYYFDVLCHDDDRTDLVPSEYGMILFDFKTNHLLDMNHYTSISHLSAFGVLLHQQNYGSETNDHVRLLMEDHRLSVTRRTWPHIDDINGKLVIDDLGPITDMTAIYDYCHKSRDQVFASIGETPPTAENPTMEYLFTVDTRPLKLFEYDTNEGGHSKFLAKLKELDFDITPEVEEIWQGIIAGHGDDDD